MATRAFSRNCIVLRHRAYDSDKDTKKCEEAMRACENALWAAYDPCRTEQALQQPGGGDRNADGAAVTLVVGGPFVYANGAKGWIDDNPNNDCETNQVGVCDQQSCSHGYRFTNLCCYSCTGRTDP